MSRRRAVIASRFAASAAVLLVGLLAPDGAAAQKTVDSAEAAAKALADAQGGDVVCLADGLYRDFKLTLQAKGSSARPVTFRAANPGKATLTGESSITITGTGIVVEGLVFDQAWRGGAIVAFSAAENCRLTECAFIECGNPRSTFGRAVEMVGGSRNNRVDHCYMQGNLSMGMGVKVGEPDNLANTGNAFDHNYFRDIKNRSSNGQESIQLGQGPAGETAVRAVVEYNLFERANGDPEIISNKTSHNILRFNTFRDCGHGELVLRGGNHVRVEGNFFFNCKGGVRVHGADHILINNHIAGCQHGIVMPFGDKNYEGVANVLVAFNTIVDCAKPGIGVGSATGPTPADDKISPRDVRLANNIVIAAKGTLVDSVSDKRIVWEQNIVCARDKAQVGLNHPGLVQADPALVQVEGVWRLPRTKSPAIGVARAVKDFPVGDDIDGQPRSGALDVGCDQASDAPMVRRPLEPRDVGPTWMKGDPACIKRIENPKPIPPAEKKPKK